MFPSWLFASNMTTVGPSGCRKLSILDCFFSLTAAYGPKPRLVELARFVPMFTEIGPLLAEAIERPLGKRGFSMEARAAGPTELTPERPIPNVSSLAYLCGSQISLCTLS